MENISKSMASSTIEDKTKMNNGTSEEKSKFIIEQSTEMIWPN